jgi:hypothetical protein
VTALALLLFLSGQSPAAGPPAAGPPAARPPAVIALDDPSAGYCLATGFCRATGERGPAPGILFLAVGLVSVGVVGLRRRPGA